MYTRISPLPEMMMNLSDEAWYGLLIENITNQSINGVEFPGSQRRKFRHGSSEVHTNKHWKRLLLFTSLLKTRQVFWENR